MGITNSQYRNTPELFTARLVVLYRLPNMTHRIAQQKERARNQMHRKPRTPIVKSAIPTSYS